MCIYKDSQIGSSRSNMANAVLETNWLLVSLDDKIGFWWSTVHKKITWLQLRWWDNDTDSDNDLGDAKVTTSTTLQLRVAGINAYEAMDNLHNFVSFCRDLIFWGSSELISLI